MRRISLLAFGLVFTAMFAFSATAQAPAGKVGFIDTGMFADEKEGITRYYNTLVALEKETAPMRQELQNMNTRLNAIAQEIQRLQNPPAGVPSTPASNAEQIRQKNDEGGKLQRELEFKTKEYEALVQRLSGERLGPINQDIGNALSDFAKQNGYAMVFDIEKLAEAGVVLAADPAYDITKAFIAFYNKRPAGAATAGNPR